MARGFDLEAATAHLAKRDRALGKWMKRIGPLEMDGWRKPFDTVDALSRSILYQQLSGKAAATIVSRVEAAAGSRKLVPEALGRLDDAALRACGVSGNKVLALRDLCRRAEASEVPAAGALPRVDDATLIERLTAVRGIGRWTVEMLLIFRLGRPDVLPVDDLGVRKGAQVLDGLEVAPTPKELLARGADWGPYRTLASLYLWRIADGEGVVEPAKKVKRSQG
ncbi:DNA-3-methyladenine glycosylase 2 family protein [Silanimonas sp.]|jgi:DNA-3-methyladenine glycosylase II|uniref:DNA-3-methyladenine glycosylase family protein n=1 Tax=Silanimonas sp. TaxID=1929290 RepID=UPI0022C1273C|nr:DNA-3-methyladenine glycosylase 2 family protein [Silanimonas sp.]MCZ8113981.1 DNA-3-methyladenine glycosylase 2 family protein [Silanimonas sp.]